MQTLTTIHKAIIAVCACLLIVFLAGGYATKVHLSGIGATNVSREEARARPQKKGNCCERLKKETKTPKASKTALALRQKGRR